MTPRAPGEGPIRRVLPVLTCAGGAATLLAAAPLVGPALLLGTAGSTVPVPAPHAESPPAAHTGGFGEPTCRACHAEFELNLEGSFTVEGLPERYTPGETYALALVLRSPGMARAGFQAAVRHAEGDAMGRSAGTLEAVDHSVRVRPDTLGVRYMQHEPGGYETESQETVTWAFLWTAPTGPAGRVAIHAAANSANGDDSPLGDLVYSAAYELESAPVDPPARR